MFSVGITHKSLVQVDGDLELLRVYVRVHGGDLLILAQNCGQFLHFLGRGADTIFASSTATEIRRDAFIMFLSRVLGSERVFVDFAVDVGIDPGVED